MNARAGICTCVACGQPLPVSSDLDHLLAAVTPMLRDILLEVSRRPGMVARWLGFMRGCAMPLQV